MPAFLLGALVFAARLAFGIPVLVLLVRLFLRTRMKSFLWLITALIVWPVLATTLTLLVPFFLTIASPGGLHGPSTLSLLTFINLGEVVVDGVLLLLAVFLLDREMTSRMQAGTAAPPPPL